ncbi:FKBP-type peptidyl-prolyl cis-trans isomerase [Citrifermentans bremense]|nr:FKBP-type peptidyl-prolyl cis-trans isomerase [Citrifermentans bremense]
MTRVWIVAIIAVCFSCEAVWASASDPAPAAAAAASGLVDLNLASKEQLMTLPGIGEEEAGKIIDGRPYSEKTELLRKKILPSSLLYRIIDKLTINFKAFNEVGKAKEKETFLAEMRSSKTIRTVKTASGLSYQDLKAGHGAKVVNGKKVRVQYTGWLQDGTKFDSSLDRNKPITFTLGKGEVIRGWDEGIQTMRAGGKRRLIIPPVLAYGDKGSGGKIPPKATLVFDVEVLDVEP